MGKMEKAAPAVTLEAVTVPLADGRRGVVLVLTDEYSRKTVMRAMPASPACNQTVFPRPA